METTQQWVASLKKAYPHLPDALPIDLETELLEQLERWFKHVEKLRSYYDQVERAELPDSVRNESGKRQIIPVLLSLEDMTPEEVNAWHDLFVCLSAQLADIGTNYWRVQSSKGSSMTLTDVLNYLPVVFLYVLSSFNPYPKVTSHEKNFSHSEDGRVRLITWVYRDARRHITSYLTQHIHTVRQGSTYVQRLRLLVNAIQRQVLTAEGSLPPEDTLVEKIRETHYGKQVSENTLRDHVTDLLSHNPTVSISDTFDGSGDRELSLEHTLTADYTNVETDYDPGLDLEEDVKGVEDMRTAVIKLLAVDCVEQLTFSERFLLGN